MRLLVHVDDPDDHIHRGGGGRRVAYPYPQDVLVVAGVSGIFTGRQLRAAGQVSRVLVLDLPGIRTQLPADP